MKGKTSHEDLALMAQCDCFISIQCGTVKLTALLQEKGALNVGDDSHEKICKERNDNAVYY